MTKIFSLPDLESLVGIPRRTIRSYIEKGLLPQPIGAGRGAHYDEGHLLRLCAIRVLRDRDSSLSDIRHYLLGRELSDLTGYPGRLIASDASLAPALTAVFPDHADSQRVPEDPAGYLRWLRSQREDTKTGSAQSAFEADSPERRYQSAPRRLYASLAEPRMKRTGGVPPSPPSVSPTQRWRARTEPVRSIAIMPDVELLIRGTWKPDEIRRIERAAEQLMRILSGEGEDD